ncbi:LytR/AlgR family response regulator transcription factor [Aestuariibacter salexigens]|uniref:LytR/AlgR family response regulator transcription factor n=1 Tax=Aestuariibacter salexigens TaxID=226010 RepID=UPI0004010385|nr:LytTR family DNA-binding domain-containing protein [Aestuariibacter salexigens]
MNTLWIHKLDRHPQLYGFCAFALYVLINNTINATSEWMEANRGGEPAIALWEPFCWEYTSALSTFLLLPLLVLWFRRYPPRFTGIVTQVVAHLIGTLIFSALHIFFMVVMRKAVYHFVGGHYNFGDVGMEFLYEYRKDAWGYVLVYVLFHVFQFVYRRLKGDASLIAEEGEESEDLQTENKSSCPEHLLVKKLDKEFLVKVADIEYLESAGNYVNLHSKGRIYPFRGTLGTLTERLAQKGFHRIHRSLSINIHFVQSIEAKPSGDAVVTLQSGVNVNMSRRYRDGFKQLMS